jgi:hypothetical protein
MASWLPSRPSSRGQPWHVAPLGQPLEVAVAPSLFVSAGLAGACSATSLPQVTPILIAMDVINPQELNTLKLSSLDLYTSNLETKTEKIRQIYLNKHTGIGPNSFRFALITTI